FAPEMCAAAGPLPCAWLGAGKLGFDGVFGFDGWFGFDVEFGGGRGVAAGSDDCERAGRGACASMRAGAPPELDDARGRGTVDGAGTSCESSFLTLALTTPSSSERRCSRDGESLPSARLRAERCLYSRITSSIDAMGDSKVNLSEDRRAGNVV